MMQKQIRDDDFHRFADRFRPTEHMPGRGAGLFAAWFAPAGIAVMRAFRAGGQQMKSLYQSARVKVIQ